jgi:hypothetical protein
VTVRQDLHIRQGATFSFVWTKRDSAGAAVDLTGYTARAAIKRALSSTADAYLSTGSDARGGTIALGGAAGTVTLSMDADQAATLGYLSSVEDRLWQEQGCDAEDHIELRYDLELVSGAGIVTRELEGRAVVYREVTR